MHLIGDRRALAKLFMLAWRHRAHPPLGSLARPCGTMKLEQNFALLGCLWSEYWQGRKAGCLLPAAQTHDWIANVSAEDSFGCRENQLRRGVVAPMAALSCASMATPGRAVEYSLRARPRSSLIAPRILEISGAADPTMLESPSRTNRPRSPGCGVFARGCGRAAGLVALPGRAHTFSPPCCL